MRFMVCFNVLVVVLRFVLRVLFVCSRCIMSVYVLDSRMCVDL